MTAIAVTGASGFVGRHVCAILQQRGCRVLPLSRQQLASPDLPAALGDSDALVHLAGRAHVLAASGADAPRAYHEANVQLTQVVVEACIGAGVPRVVFLSSAGVLGCRSPSGGFTDQSNPSPHDAYTHSKLQAEQWLRARAAARLQVVIVRAPLIYGPGAPGNFSRLLHAIRAGWPLPIARLLAPRSMLGVRNLADVLHAAGAHPAAAGQTMLVADQQSISVAELARALGRYLHRPARLFSMPPALLAGMLRVLGKSADVARLLDPFELRPSIIADKLGWSPPFSLEQELAWAVALGRREQADAR
ncbi:MAG TPA: NAD-dependent epimerase/dehydratase family protein [Steroidobacteraceae bacterium]|jgi:UDP-glucose 4-epimerase